MENSLKNKLVEKPADERRQDELRKSIIENLGHIRNDWDLEKLYEYSKLLVSDDKKKRLAIAMLLNEWVTEKKAGEVYYFMVGYLHD